MGRRREKIKSEHFNTYVSTTLQNSISVLNKLDFNINKGIILLKCLLPKDEMEIKVKTRRAISLLVLNLRPRLKFLSMQQTQMPN